MSSFLTTFSTKPNNDRLLILEIKFSLSFLGKDKIRFLDVEELNLVQYTIESHSRMTTNKKEKEENLRMIWKTRRSADISVCAELLKTVTRVDVKEQIYQRV
jgi:hypothetical protein